MLSSPLWPAPSSLLSDRILSALSLSHSTFFPGTRAQGALKAQRRN